MGEQQKKRENDDHDGTEEELGGNLKRAPPVSLSHFICTKKS